MTDKNHHPLSSRDVLKRIGLGDDNSEHFLLDVEDVLESPL